LIERKFISQKMKEFAILEFISNNLKKVGHSYTKLQRTPLGEKIIIYASRPGLIVGRKGQSIKDLTRTLKKRFELENPQIEINEVENPNLDAQIVAERIAGLLERFGTTKFKAIGHKTMTDVMNSGALGIEIHISGKIPSSRAKSWRFYQGYLKKCGDVALEGVRKAYASAKLKSGIVGVQVAIMPPDIDLPDEITEIKQEEKPVEAPKAEEQQPAAPEKQEPEVVAPAEAKTEHKPAKKRESKKNGSHQ
jgi:small subunit ribosomal protein S3